MDILYEVYAKLDNNNCIVGIEGTAFHSKKWLEENGYVKIDEGSNGEIYGHCQPNYLTMMYGKPMYDEEFHPNYIIDDGKVRELNDEEKEVLFPKPTPQPTEQEIINAQLMLEIARLKAGV